MSQHIQKVAENLYALTARKLKPLIVVVDDDNNYITHHGELTDYQLPAFELGQSCIEVLPFLVGLENESYVSLPIVKFNEDNVSSVSVIKINVHRYVVLLEVVDEYLREQEATQDSNETKLLYRKLQLVTQQLELANNAKSRFISGMSHEFRTPLSSVLGYSTLLADKFSESDDEFKYASAIENNARYLLSLIDNVLEHAQLEKDKLLVSIAPFSVDEMIANLEQMFRGQAENNSINFSIDKNEMLPDAIYSDQVRLQQILINLIGNAFKFTDAGAVKVKVDWNNDQLVVAIADTGKGIPQQHQASVFQAYNRYDAANKKGAGLGLAISSQIAEKLKGRLELESTVGVGSVFTLRVEARSADLSSIKESVLNEKLKSVLIVEDDPDLMALLKIYLDEIGCSTIAAIDGEEALLKCESEKIDLVLLDMQLPKISGLEVVKKLRALKNEVPVIAMTASSNSEDKELALLAGCNEFLSKPIQLSPLMNAINNGMHQNV